MKIRALILFFALAVESFGQPFTLRDAVFVGGLNSAPGTPAPPSSLNTNLISFWKLDETTGSRVDSEPTGTPQDLTAEADANFTTGIIGNAALFDGPAGWLWRADSSDLSGGNTDFTIAGWYYHNFASFAAMIFSKWGGSAADQEYQIYFYPDTGTGHIYFNIGDGSSLTFVSDASTSISVGNWYFIVAWHDSVNNQIGLSVNDGTPATTAWTTGAADGTSAFTIGAGDEFGTGYNDTGYRIDEVGFWRKVLTSGERTSLYNSGSGKTCCPF